jgi:hypothetical protein
MAGHLSGGHGPDDAGGQFSPVWRDILDVKLTVGLAGGETVRATKAERAFHLGLREPFHHSISTVLGRFKGGLNGGADEPVTKKFNPLCQSAMIGY